MPDIHNLVRNVRLSDLDLARHMDVGQQFREMQMSALQGRGLRRNPVAEHDAAFRKAIGLVGHEIDPNNLPRININRLGFRDLECTFLWGPGGEWTGFVRIASAFEDTERRLCQYMARESFDRASKVFEVPVQSRYGTICFMGRCINRDPYRFAPGGEPSRVDSVLLFKDYEEQASYAALVEDLR